MSQDIVADALNQVMNCKKSGKQEVELRRYSKFLIKILDLAKEYGYLDYKLDEKAKTLKIKMMELHVCKAVKPRYYVSVDEITKYIRRYLPARGFGIVVVSTSSGLLTHEQAKEKNLGGSIISYFY